LANSKTIKIFGLRKNLTKERLAVRIPRVNGLNTNHSAIKSCMMNRQMRVKNLLVQLNALLHVTQSK